MATASRLSGRVTATAGTPTLLVGPPRTQPAPGAFVGPEGPGGGFAFPYGDPDGEDWEDDDEEDPDEDEDEDEEDEEDEEPEWYVDGQTALDWVRPPTYTDFAPRSLPRGASRGR